jgi:hypothetical protein
VREIHTKGLGKNFKEREHLENLGVDDIKMNVKDIKRTDVGWCRA